MRTYTPLACGLRLAITSGAFLALHGTGALARTQVLERVEITGSSIKRIEGEGALPVQVLTREDVQRTGATNVEQLLQTISSVSGVKNLTLTLGVRNLFDRDPPYTNAGGQTSFQAGYEPLYADPRGRFVYARLAYAFK